MKNGTKPTRQCELANGDRRAVLWVPLAFARVGMTWEGWTVAVAYPHTTRYEVKDDNGSTGFVYHGDGL